jgi:hypothetical protein
MPGECAQADDEAEDVLRRQLLAVHRDAADREHGAPAGVHQRLVGAYGAAPADEAGADNIRAFTPVFT